MLPATAMGRAWRRSGSTGKLPVRRQVPVLGVQRRVLGEDHPSTLTSAGNLATSLSRQGKRAQAELIEREILCARRRVPGEEHPNTLASAAHHSFPKSGS